MFIKIKTEDVQYEKYINIFKITYIRNSRVDTPAPLGYSTSYDKSKTDIICGEGNSSSIVVSHEPVSDFIRRLKKETKDTSESIKERFEILDL